MNQFRNYFPSTMLSATTVVLGLLASGCTQEPPRPEITATEPVKTEATNSAEKPLADYNVLEWEDDFNGSSLNAQNWTPEVKDGWYNNEKQATTSDRRNLTVTGGNLVITALKENYNGKAYTSARIVTKGNQDFRFGRIDVRAKLPKGKGIWPAIWLLGSNDSQVSWPACGEIDIMELKGSNPQTSLTALHFGNSVATKPPALTSAYSLPNGLFSDDFHVFTLVRSLNKMRFYVDNNEYFSATDKDVSVYPFNNPFYMILNVAVGGDFDGDPDASTVFPQQMLVDYVKYYKYAE
ncbi:glycoside hydrolase family 16 protein [Hymenobacter sp. ASUV-10]|uniref:Glycoside hydrolase family 16 protein n=1 Tax=Hymenobacter aranciens TaxID=3063996 RepID=A0ABT9BD94_9BACT|nr:glycoside hydrolase family 16 protein [Hymenobacter sp. ASUV-10]MDO7874513.1 glycoside hydrolase family 16 protein [Hymenobacter sp. ASUV-10]